VEGLPELSLERAEAVVREARGDAACLADLVVLAFQTRDCRGGKGEKALFATLLWELLARHPATTLKLLPLIPEYGSWRDLCVLWDAVDGAPPEKPKKEKKAPASFAEEVGAEAAEEGGGEGEARRRRRRASCGSRPTGGPRRTRRRAPGPCASSRPSRSSASRTGASSTWPSTAASAA